MKSLFEVKEIDRVFYAKRLRDWLPDKIIDVHTHVWLKRFKPVQKDASSASGRVAAWADMIADENPVEHLKETYRLMFPGKIVTPLMFTNIVPERNFTRANDYVARVARENKFPALIFSHPQWSGEEFEKKIEADGLLGAKSYLSFAAPGLAADEITIFDFFPRHQLEILNKLGLVMMLHIPRNNRLRDPVNLAQMLEIEECYPNIKLIIAHVGRAYCPEDIGDAFKVLAKTRKMYFDISANTNADTFRRLLEAVGPKRVLFGSDLPITRMRMRRICENGKYINLVPKGLYGDVSRDSHMREVEGGAAESLTYFMYEELDAFRRAAHAVKLERGDLEDVFYNNAERLLKKMEKRERSKK